MPKVSVGRLEEFVVEQPQRVVAAAIPLCVVRTGDGSVYALRDECTHEDACLSEGEVWRDEIECPRHQSRFDLRTGAAANPPATLPVPTFRTSVEDGVVHVEIP